MFSSELDEAPGSALLPRPGESTVVIAPHGAGPGYWAGAPSAALGDDGIYLAYRLRRPIGAGRGYAIAVARSADGVRFDTLTMISREEVGAESLERPGLVRDHSGRWRPYLSCATPGTKPCRSDSGRVRRKPPPSGTSRGREDPRQGPGDQAERHLANVGVLPPAGRARRRGPDGDRLRDQSRRGRMDVARHRAERPARLLGLAGHPDQRGLAGRGPGHRLLRRARHGGGELRGTNRHRARHRAGIAGCGRRSSSGGITPCGPGPALSRHPRTAWRAAPYLLRDGPPRRRARTAHRTALAAPAPGRLRHPITLPGAGSRLQGRGWP